MVAAELICNLTEKNIPILLFLDDLQWTDQGTINLLEEIAEKIVQ